MRDLFDSTNENLCAHICVCFVLKYVCRTRADRTNAPLLATKYTQVRDMAQADFGRMEIELAEVEMPGLMSCVTEFGPSQPLKGANISGSLHMTIQTAVLIETLVKLGAVVRWCSCNIFSTQDHAAAAVRDSRGLCLKGQRQYWWCTDQMLN